MSEFADAVAVAIILGLTLGPWLWFYHVISRAAPHERRVEW